jgi:competence protein ComEC
MASWVSVLAVYATLLATTLVLRRWSRGRRGLRTHRPRRRSLTRPALGCLVLLLALAGPELLAGRRPSLGGASGRPPSELRVSILDIGQGDAILLQPPTAAPLLVDGGPPGDGLESELDRLGVGSLAAAIATHDEADHVGGLEELLGSMPIGRLAYADAGRRLLGEARAAGATPTRIAAGGELRSGALRLQVLWPPRELLGPRPEEPNTRSLVIEARWHGFTMLLTGDAEAEAVPIDPGPIDVLKVAHHGSADAGLGGLLDRTRPSIAVISVGDDNPFGHPVASTLATLAAHSVEVLRTDIVGTVTIKAGPSGIEVSGAH